MRVTIIVHDADEAPRSFNLAGRSTEELDQLQDEVLEWLTYHFTEVRRSIEEQDMAAFRDYWARNDAFTRCDHRSFSHGTPESGIRSADCVRNGVLS